jgi:hypothetical protein
MRARAFKGNHARTKEKPKFTLTIGRVYAVKGYYTGDFRARCCESLGRSARLKVTDPMKSTLQVDDEIEIPFVHADFIPAIVEEFKKPVEDRFRYRIGEGPRSA